MILENALPSKRFRDSPHAYITPKKQQNSCVLLLHELILIGTIKTFIEFTCFVLSIYQGILVLLIFRHQIIKIGLCLSEFHFVHTLSGIPMQEGLTTEHNSELLSNTLPRLLDTSGVTNKDTRHFHSSGWDITNGRLEVIGDPFNKVTRVLAHHLEHLIVNFLTGHGSTEHHGAGEVTSVTWIASAHHVFGIECLLGELGDVQNTEVLRLFCGQWGKSNKEEVKTGEWDHIHRELTKITVQLAGETERAGGSSDSRGNKVVEITVTWVGKLERTEANIIKCLIVKSKALIGILHKLMDRKHGVVWLHDSIGNLGRGHNTVGRHDTIGEFLTNLGHEKSSHTRSGPSPHRVSDLEPLETITRLGLLTCHVHNRIHQLGTLSIMPLGPIIPRPTLSKDKVIRSKHPPGR
mmetsp:Transcript_25929/g.36968  ORF Transcript_25929/g.36968 Transcript_25929/m.36968 type:complete len:407 (-) Transcript_25929:320-1540(-)